jgi:very-short-patch-repair endonuclease
MRLRFRAEKPPSRLERRFFLHWQSLGGPALEREFRFHAERKWRADFAHVESRTLIEIEGGVFIKGGGRHNRAAGFITDAEKYLAAFLAGWNVVRLTEAQITAPNIEQIIRRVRDTSSCQCSLTRTPSCAEMPACGLENVSASTVVAEP